MADEVAVVHEDAHRDAAEVHTQLPKTQKGAVGFRGGGGHGLIEGNMLNTLQAIYTTNYITMHALFCNITHRVCLGR